jgi:hypothetical protein
MPCLSGYIATGHVALAGKNRKILCVNSDPQLLDPSYASACGRMRAFPEVLKQGHLTPRRHGFDRKLHLWGLHAPTYGANLDNQGRARRIALLACTY